MDTDIIDIDNSVEWKLSGMTCSSCASRVEKFLKEKGLKDVTVSFGEGEVQFKKPEELDIEMSSLKTGLKQIGYKVISAERRKPPFLTLERKLLIAAIFTLPLIIAHIFHAVGVRALHMSSYSQAILCFPVMLIGWQHFGKSAWHALKMGQTNMDVLIALGSTVAFIYSMVILFAYPVEMVYFEAAASIITLVLTGNYIEKKALQSANSAVRAASDSIPESAKVVGQGGEVTEMPSDRLETGQSVLVVEGDSIPADGMITEGELLVNESLLTGESAPVAKTKGQEVSAGTIVAEGNAQFLVQRAGKGSYISRLMDMVRKSQSEKPPIHKLSDKVSSIFIPVVIGLALLTFGVNYFGGFTSLSGAIIRGVTVLVIACPCAMGLATPTAIMVGSGWAVKKGVVFRNGPAFEEINQLKQIIFDKTGTLTRGRFTVDIPEDQDEKYLAVILAMEQRSSHPIARSLVSFINEKYPELKPRRLRNIREIKGSGMEAYDVEKRKYELCGSASEGGVKEIVLRIDETPVFTLHIGDQLKEDAKDAIEYLRKRDIEPIIVSGDKEVIVAKTASTLGVVKYHAEQLPEQKLALLTKYQGVGKTGLIGDGINDAAAIAQANVGFAFTDTSHLNLDSADVVLLSGELSGLTKALMVSKQTYKTIKQNLFWAFSYNIIAIPLAAVGLVNPIAGVAFMAFSDLLVIGNAFLLRGRLNRGVERAMQDSGD